MTTHNHFDDKASRARAYKQDCQDLGLERYPDTHNPDNPALGADGVRNLFSLSFFARENAESGSQQDCQDLGPMVRKVAALAVEAKNNPEAARVIRRALEGCGLAPKQRTVLERVCWDAVKVIRRERRAAKAAGSVVP